MSAIAARVEWGPNVGQVCPKPIGEEAAELPPPLAIEKTVSVIVVSYRTGPLLSRCVAAALAQPETLEVIIVDNGNWAHEIKRVQAVSPAGAAKVHIVSGQGNVGFAAGCNIGARQAEGDFLLILNPDAVLPTGGLTTLLQNTGELAHPWLMGAKLIDPDGGEQAGSRRAPLTPWTAFVEMTHLHAIAPRHPYFRRFNHHTDDCPGETVSVPVVSGACMFTPREDYFAVGGMDEGYFLHAEDIDICLRYAEEGGGVYFCPEAAVTHHKSSSRVSPTRVEYHKARSVVRYFWKHFRKPYPAPFLLLVSGGVWMVFAMRATRNAVFQALGALGLGFRRAGAFKRLRRMSKRSPSRPL